MTPCARIDARHSAIAQLTDALPGSIPYNNLRPINVSGRFDGRTLYEVMCESHPHISPLEWKRLFSLGRIRKDGVPVGPEQRVRGGEQFTHLFPDTVEPDVDPAIQILWEDDAIIVVNKPAPLPMHPSGRFNLNTLTSLLQTVYAQKLHLAHRLDANTTGIVLLSRNDAHARFVQQQFDRSEITKSYLVRCHGNPADDTFARADPIGRERGRAGLRLVDADGKPSRTQFEVLRRRTDGTSLLSAEPITGRTNQIRIHLWAAGHSVVGDPLYLPDSGLGASQTLTLRDSPMCLHAHQLTFIHPLSRERVVAEAASPAWSD